MTKQEAIDVISTMCGCFKCEEGECNYDCDTCEYDTSHRETMGALELAIDCIEKQIPKKPTLGGAYKINEWECPNCKSYFAELNDRPRHCAECGQAIRWE